MTVEDEEPIWKPPPYPNGHTNGSAPPEDDEPQHHANSKAKAIFANDLRHGAPPKPLIRETFLAAEGWTVLYANGGTGKGMVTVWLMKEFLALHADDDVDIAILDYEDHEWEWGSRLRGMGFSEEDLHRIHYVRPLELLDKGLPAIKDTVAEFDVGLWIIDSYSYSAGSGDKMGGAKEAMEFFKAAFLLPGIGLVLAHTSENVRHAAKPFGSVYIHNAARETWSAAKNEIDQPYIAPGTIVIGPNARMQIELVNKKRSVGPNTIQPQLLTFTFWPDGTIEVDHTVGKEPSVGDRILDILADGVGRGSADIKALLDVDGGKPVSRDVTNQNIGRLRKKAQVATEGPANALRYYSPQGRMNQSSAGGERDEHSPPYTGGGDVHLDPVNTQMNMNMSGDEQEDEHNHAQG